MTRRGTTELYLWLTAAWPLVIRPGASETFQRAKQEELYKTFKEYGDEEVRTAFEKWTDENDKFPTTKNIINEIRWAQALKAGRRPDPTMRYSMDIIMEDGTEYMIEYGGKAAFTWDEFINIPRNKDRLDPVEWERRFRARRKRILAELAQKRHEAAK